jgi:hypothetical protein
MQLDKNILIGAAIAFIFLVLALMSRTKKQEFVAKKFITDNESEFLNRLERAVPELRFHAQVSMGAVLDAAVPWHQNARENMRVRGKFSQKIIDFVAQSRKTGEIVAIIELDDRTHDAEKDRRRDEMLYEAGYNVVRWDSRAKPQIKEIREVLVDLM